MLNPSLVAAVCADYAGLLALFRWKVRDSHLAEDLVHQAFAEALEKLQRGQIADPGRFSGFVCGVAINLLRNHRRRIANRTEARGSIGQMEALTSDASPADQQYRESSAQQVRNIVKALPTARERELVRRFYLDEQSKAVVCGELGLSPLQFDKIAFRARRRMRTLLEAQDLEQDSCSALSRSISGERASGRSAPRSLAPAP